MAQGGMMEEISEVARIMFVSRELNEINDFRRGFDYIEVFCGCTTKFGDIRGILKIDTSGRFTIFCQCTENCGATFTPDEFESHCGKEGNRDWKKHIWVHRDNRKVSLWKTVLIDYYKLAANLEDAVRITSRKRIVHRDEFMSCTLCNKMRRFRLSTGDQLREYHDAYRNMEWRCADYPGGRTHCEIPEERDARKYYRACPKQGKCKGCMKCLCFGCVKCKFVDCNCQECVSFLNNALI